MAKQVIVGRAALLVRDRIKNDVLGKHHDEWPPLAPSTLARKSADTPLVETGSFRNSIGATIGHHVAWVGTNDQRGIWFEHGTSKMPPRPWLMAGWHAAEKEVMKMAGKEFRRAFRGLGGHAMRAEELFHLLRELAHIAHQIKDQFHELVQGDEEKAKRRN